MLKAVHPDWSIASWSVRFCLEKEDVIAVLSGMSALEQVLDNVKTSDEAAPLTDEERRALAEAMRIYRESAPIKQSEIDRYAGLMYHGVPVTAILQAYSICQIQPDPGFSDDNNYLKNAIAEAEHVNFVDGLVKQVIVAPDGTDITEKVETAVAWLTANTFSRAGLDDGNGKRPDRAGALRAIALTDEFAAFVCEGNGRRNSYKRSRFRDAELLGGRNHNIWVG